MHVAASVVLFHPDLEHLQQPLAVLAEWPHGPVLVHVNEATDAIVSAVQALLPKASVSSSIDNQGFSGGHNRLLEAAFAQGVDAVVVHNPDLVLDPGAVPALATTSTGYDGRVLLGPALELADGTTMAAEGLVDTVGIRWTASGRHLDTDQGQPWPPVAREPRAVAGISGACLFVPLAAHNAIRAIGGEFFDEDLIAYREDAELGFRAALLGIPSVVVPAATGRHGRSLRGTTRGAAAHIDRLGVRNRFLIAFKYGRHRPGRLLPALARDLVVILGVLVKERSSATGLNEAWQLRARMRDKGRLVLDASMVTSREAAGL